MWGTSSAALTSEICFGFIAIHGAKSPRTWQSSAKVGRALATVGQLCPMLVTDLGNVRPNMEQVANFGQFFEHNLALSDKLGYDN